MKAVAFSPDGQRIITGSTDGTARVWNAATGLELFSLTGHEPSVCAVAYSPAGDRVVTGTGGPNGIVWDLATHRELFLLKGHTAGISSVAFSRDGQRIVTGSADQTARVWDAATGRELVLLKGHTNQINAVAFSPNGLQIVTGSDDRTARVWDVEGRGQPRILSGHGVNVLAVSFSPDGARIVVGGLDRAAAFGKPLPGRNCRWFFREWAGQFRGLFPGWNDAAHGQLGFNRQSLECGNGHKPAKIFGSFPRRVCRGVFAGRPTGGQCRGCISQGLAGEQQSGITHARWEQSRQHGRGDLSRLPAHRHRWIG